MPVVEAEPSTAGSQRAAARCKRRTHLSKSRKIFRIVAIAASLIGVAVGGYFGFWLYHLKRLQVVAPGVLIRSAQPTEFGLRHAVNCYGVKTVISLQLFDFRLHGGLLDPGRPDGRKEAEFVASLGARHVQYPMGDEQCWPWPTPWQLESFFETIDNPANRPVLIHCMGGRHRTGTLSALYRLEYDRWPIDRTLAEMYSFDFGLPIPAQEHNLRTYTPRPRPTADQWQSLVAALGPQCEAPPADYDELVRRVRQAPEASAVRAAVAEYIERDRPFALPFTERVVESPTSSLAVIAAAAARRVLNDATSGDQDTAAAASLIADFGSPDDQAILLESLVREAESPTPTERYEALVQGVTNRYTPNRIAYLRPLLADRRRRLAPAAAKYRYCDTAVVRLASITDQLPIIGWSEEGLQTQGLHLAQAWFDAHPKESNPGPLLPPGGNHTIETGDGPQEEDLSKMRAAN